MSVQIQMADEAIEFDRFGIPRAREGYWKRPETSRDPFALVRVNKSPGLTPDSTSATMNGAQHNE